jgi:hypothetical protein
MIIRNLASKTKNPSILRLRSAQAPARVTRQAEQSRGHLALKTRHLILKNCYLQESGYSVKFLILVFLGITFSST